MSANLGWDRDQALQVMPERWTEVANVVYHAQRDEIEAIRAQIRRVLRPQGLLFITFKSTLDSQNEQGVKLAPFTWAPIPGIEVGVAHYYFDADEVRRLLQDCELISMVYKQE